MAWNRPQQIEERAQPNRSATKRTLGLSVGFAVVLVAALFFVSRTAGPGKAPLHKGTVKRDKTSAASRQESPRVKDADAKSVTRPASPTNRIEALLSQDPVRIRRNSTNAFMMGRGPKAFRNGTEQLICRVFCCPLGTMPAPLPTLPEEDMKHILKVLTDQNQIKPDDSDEIATQKEILEDARLEMARYVNDGGDPNEFLRFYHKQLVKAFEFREAAIAELNRIKEEEHDLSLARQMLEKVNERLKSDGIVLVSADACGGLEDEEE